MLGNSLVTCMEFIRSSPLNAFRTLKSTPLYNAESKTRANIITAALSIPRLLKWPLSQKKKAVCYFPRNLLQEKFPISKLWTFYCDWPGQYHKFKDSKGPLPLFNLNFSVSLVQMLFALMSSSHLDLKSYMLKYRFTSACFALSLYCWHLSFESLNVSCGGSLETVCNYYVTNLLFCVNLMLLERQRIRTDHM